MGNPFSLKLGENVTIGISTDNYPIILERNYYPGMFVGEGPINTQLNIILDK